MSLFTSLYNAACEQPNPTPALVKALKAIDEKYDESLHMTPIERKAALTASRQRTD